MIRFTFPQGEGPTRLLCLGAHADDIEIGCGGTVLRLLAEVPALAVRWIVFSGQGKRADEARNGAHAILRDAAKAEVEVLSFRDGYFPSQSADIKDYFENLKRNFDPSIVLTHWRGDAHQDHRLIAELTQNTFRNHLILEYEVPKYDGDLGNPGFFVPLTEAQLDRKLEALRLHFPSQQSRAWFSGDTFRAIARLRGIGCNAPEGVAEAFYAAKLVF